MKNQFVKRSKQNREFYHLDLGKKQLISKINRGKKSNFLIEARKNIAKIVETNSDFYQLVAGKNCKFQHLNAKNKILSFAQKNRQFSITIPEKLRISSKYFGKNHEFRQRIVRKFENFVKWSQILSVGEKKKTPSFNIMCVKNTRKIPWKQRTSSFSREKNIVNFGK